MCGCCAGVNFPTILPLDAGTNCSFLYNSQNFFTAPLTCQQPTCLNQFVRPPSRRGTCTCFCTGMGCACVPSELCFRIAATVADTACEA